MSSLLLSRPERPPLSRIAVAGALAIAIHAALMGLITVLPEVSPKRGAQQARRVESVETRRISSQEWALARGERSAPKPAPTTTPVRRRTPRVVAAPSPTEAPVEVAQPSEPAVVLGTPMEDAPPAPRLNLNLSPNAFASAVGPARTSVPSEGERVARQFHALEDDAWRFFGFMSRVRDAIEARWKPGFRLRTEDLMGRANERPMWVTQLVAVLDPRGELLGTVLIRSSGMAILDDEAMKALRQAAPFPNPPEALVRDDGTILMPFTFTVEMTDGGGFSLGRMRR